MQYLVLVIALATAVVLARHYVPTRDNGAGPGFLQQIRTLQELDPRQWSQQVPTEGATGGTEKKHVYRWRGDDGSWPYGDRPPQGVEYERVEPTPPAPRSAEQFRGGGDQPRQENPE